MYISINWIKDFVDLDGIDIKGLINKFTLSTAEVEGYVEYGKNTYGIVVGKVLSVENVENSNKLHKLLVDIGNEKLQCVCGAKNVQVGINVAFAKAGSKVNGVDIEKTTIAGVESNGMCLSEKELGISEDHSGIMILDEELKLGIDIKKIIPVEDTVFEVDNKSLTNRPDLWGHYGIAREIAAITKRKLKPLELEDLEKYNDLVKLNINVEDKDDCLRYSAMTVDNITKKVSSYKIKTRLTYCGLRPINFLADMTNYIMLELGQPLHAFDKNFVKSINVKRLKEDNKFITLDNTERLLPKGTLMIHNDNTPVAIAGIMGGKDTEITDETNSLFLESANFDGVLIRKTALNISHRTDASARYEKMLDPELTKLAISRFIKILKDEDKDAKVSSSFTDVYLKKYPHIDIDITREYINKKIGVDFSIEEIIDILTSLEYDVKVNGESLVIGVPTFRATKDVSMKDDIIEEIARLYGYDNIVPQTNFWKVEPVRDDEVRILDYEAKKILATKYNLNEIHSYVWYDTKLNNELGIKTEDNLKIVNGLNRLDSTLRRNMGPTILNYIYKNIKNYDEFGIFEIGRTFDYNFDGKDAKESKVLGIGLTSIKENDEELVFKVKSMIEAIASINKNITLDYVENTVYNENYMHPINTFNIKYNNSLLGYISVVHPMVKDNINPKSSIVVAELLIENLANIKEEARIYKEISRYQTVEFDFSIMVDKQVKYIDIENAINTSNLKYLISYELIDIYENEIKLKNKKSVTIRFSIGSYDKTLTKEEIDEERQKLIENFLKNNMIINV